MRIQQIWPGRADDDTFFGLDGQRLYCPFLRLLFAFVIWGLIWGLLFFGEKITPLKVIGAVIVISGIALYAFSDTDKKNIAMEDVIAEDSAEGVEAGGDGNE